MCMGCSSKSNHRSSGGGYANKKSNWGGMKMGNTAKKASTGKSSGSSMYGTSNFGSPKVKMSFGGGIKHT